MALAGFGVMPWDEAEDDGMFGGMLVAEADDDGHVVSNRATPPCFFHAMLSHALTMPSPWHCDALLLMIVSVLRSLPAQRQAVFNGEAKAGRNDGRRAKGNDHRRAGHHLAHRVGRGARGRAPLDRWRW